MATILNGLLYLNEIYTCVIFYTKTYAKNFNSNLLESVGWSVALIKKYLPKQ